MIKLPYARLVILVPILLFLSLPLVPIRLSAAPAIVPAARNLPQLREGQLMEGTVDPLAPEAATSWRLTIDRDVYAVRLYMQDAEADLDLQVFDQNQNLVWSAETSEFNEQMWLYRLGNPALEDGVYTVRVAWLQDYRPSRLGVPLEKVGFRIACDQIRTNQAAQLVPGSLRSDRLEPGQGMMQSYVVTIPPDCRELRLDAWSRNADIDLFARIGKPFADPRDVDLASQSYRPREGMVVAIPAGSAGTKLYVMVVSVPDTVSADLNILASPGTQPPAALTGLPLLDALSRQAINPALELAGQATVELIGEQGGGSACVISPDGWIITNRHVVVGGASELPQQISVGFSQDHRLPPDCQFWARVVAVDTRRDLALLHIETGFYGQALPPGYRFPALELGSSQSLRIGQPLWFAGYPTIGGLGNRATFTLTSGMVSGFQNRGFGVLVKSAAEISAGNSGGAAVDEDGRLVGLPTVVAGDDTSRLAFIYPIELIPDEWLAMAGLKRPD